MSGVNRIRYYRPKFMKRWTTLTAPKRCFQAEYQLDRCGCDKPGAERGSVQR